MLWYSSFSFLFLFYLINIRLIRSRWIWITIHLSFIPLSGLSLGRFTAKQSNQYLCTSGMFALKILSDPTCPLYNDNLKCRSHFQAIGFSLDIHQNQYLLDLTNWDCFSRLPEQSSRHIQIVNLSFHPFRFFFLLSWWWACPFSIAFLSGMLTFMYAKFGAVQ